MRKILFLGFIVAFCSCSSNSKTDANDSGGVDPSQAVVRKPDSAAAQPAPAAKADTAKATAASGSGSGKSKWTYKEETDKMTSKTNYYAFIDANELLNFPAPYDGGQTATLTVRKQSGASEVTLSITKGQFTNVDGGKVQIRFDDAQPVSFPTSEPSDGSSDVIFINNASKLIKKLKTANKVIIQAEFYEAGLKTMEFDVKDFKWEH